MNRFSNAPDIATGITIEDIVTGAHLCSLCKSTEEATELAVRFLAHGIERGDKCVHLGGEATHAIIRQRLIDRGIDADRLRQTDTLVLVEPSQVGLRADATDVYRMFTFWKKMTAAAARDKFRGLRGASQMSCLSSAVTSAQQLQAYEERLTQLAEDTGCVLLCQYDPHSESAAFLLEGLCSHAYICDRGELCRNLYYLPGAEPPESPLKDRALDLLLQGLQLHEQSRRELLDTRAELARLARIVTLGELTASVAHEVAQPVAAMIADGSAALRWLANTPPRLDEARQSMTRIIASGHRAESIIQRIRSLVRKADGGRELLSIDEVIVEVAALMREQLQRTDIVLRTELSPSPPRTWAQRVQIQQVLLNLIINALEAIDARAGGKRQIIIRTSHDRNYVTVAVIDSGIGLDIDQTQFVLKPFYTTKAHGMGIGLSISSRIIEAHHGQLWAERNADGDGATFYFTLPLPSHQDSR